MDLFFIIYCLNINFFLFYEKFFNKDCFIMFLYIICFVEIWLRLIDEILVIRDYS